MAPVVSLPGSPMTDEEQQETFLQRTHKPSAKEAFKEVKQRAADRKDLVATTAQRRENDSQTQKNANGGAEDANDKVKAEEKMLSDIIPKSIISWEFTPILNPIKDREGRGSGATVDFNDSICCLIFGRDGHQRFFNSLRRHRKVVDLSLLLYNAALIAICCALLADEEAGTYLSVYAFIGALPANIQIVLCLNLTLLRSSVPHVQFWAIILLGFAMWCTAGIMLGGTRGFFLSTAAGLICILAGPFKDSYHYGFRSSASNFWSYLIGLIFHVILAGSIVFKVFRGGKVLRWPLGTRELTGEDIVVNCALTIIIYIVPWVLQGGRSILRRLRKHGAEDGRQSSVVRSKRVVQCRTLQWPLLLCPLAPRHGLASAGQQGNMVLSLGAVDVNENQLPASRSQEKDLVTLLFSTPQAFGPPDAEHSLYFVMVDQISKMLPCIGRRQSSQQRVTPYSFAKSGGKRARGPTTTAPVSMQVLMALGVWTIPAALILGKLRRSCPGQSEMWSSPSIILATVALLWNAVTFGHLSTLWNVHILRLLCVSSFDFSFLLLQVVALFLSLSDAFQYDERCLALFAWCLLFLGCLFSDAILPFRQGNSPDLPGAHFVSKTFLGAAVLLPLLATQAWFLYDVIFQDGGLYIRSRTILRVTKLFEDGVAAKNDHDGRSGLDITTDSFIVARLTSIIVFSLPLLYHLMLTSSRSTGSASLLASDRRIVGLDPTPRQQPNNTELIAPSRLFFITASVSYEAPMRNWRGGESNAHRRPRDSSGE